MNNPTPTNANGKARRASRAQMVAKAFGIPVEPGLESDFPERLAAAAAQLEPARVFESSFESSSASSLPLISIEAVDCLQAAARSPNSGAMVFCSANRPGGGWLGGSDAQEESIARRSSWGALCENAKFHGAHATGDYFYHGKTLVHQGLVFSLDDESWLEEPIPMLFAGCVAPNAKAMRQNGQKIDGAKIQQAIKERTLGVLQALASHGAKRAVLGAFGCGVFEVDPKICAIAMARAIAQGGAAFSEIVFALGPAPSLEIQKAFADLPSQAEEALASLRKSSRRGPRQRRQ